MSMNIKKGDKVVVLNTRRQKREAQNGYRKSSRGSSGKGAGNRRGIQYGQQA